MPLLLFLVLFAANANAHEVQATGEDRWCLYSFCTMFKDLVYQEASGSSFDGDSLLNRNPLGREGVR